MKTLVSTICTFLILTLLSVQSFGKDLWKQNFEHCELGTLSDGDCGLTVEDYGRDNLSIVNFDGEHALKHVGGQGDGGAYVSASAGISATNETWIRYWQYFAPGYKWGDYDTARKKVIILSTPSQSQILYLQQASTGNPNRAYVTLICQYGASLSLGYDLWGQYWHSEWDFDGQHGIKPDGWWFTPGNWYCIVARIKGDTAAGAGNGKLEYWVYDESGNQEFYVDMKLKAGSGGPYDASGKKWDEVKVDYTHNYAPPSGNVEYRDDFVISDSPLGFFPRSTDDNPAPDPPKGLIIIQ